MPTRKTLLLLVLAALVFVVAGVSPRAVHVALTANAVVLVLFVLDRRGLPAPRELVLKRDHGDVFSLAQRNEVRLTLENASPHVLRGELRENAPPCCRQEPERIAVDLPPQRRADLRYEVTPNERGRFRFGESVLRARGPMGLAFRDYRFPDPPPGRGRRPDHDWHFTVYPTLSAAAPRQVAAFARSLESGYHRLQRRVEGTTPSQIRQWVTGDSYRDINWKATARHDRPMVTQFDTDRNQTVYVFVDCGRLMNAPAGALRKLDHAVNACADLARVANERGDLVGLCCFSSAVKVWLEATGKRRQLLKILEALATISAEPRATNYDGPINAFLKRAKRRSLCLFLTTFSESASTWQLMDRLHSLRPRHVPAVVSLIDPDLERTVRERPRSFEEACRKLAAADLKEEVELFAQRLRQRRGYFLEAPADSLSLAAVQTYLDVKARGLL